MKNLNLNHQNLTAAFGLSWQESPVWPLLYLQQLLATNNKYPTTYSNTDLQNLNDNSLRFFTNTNKSITAGRQTSFYGVMPSFNIQIDQCTVLWHISTALPSLVAALAAVGCGDSVAEINQLGNVDQREGWVYWTYCVLFNHAVKLLSS